MAIPWDPVSVKAHLRLTSKCLAQSQDKIEALAPITRKDIATLLQRHNVGLARAKSQNLIQDDAMGRALELLEMHCGVLLEYFNELDNAYVRNPAVIEAASSIIYAAPLAKSKELEILRMILINRLGPDFTRSAVGNLDNHVSSKITRTMIPPSAADIDDYLFSIARSFNINWSPALSPHQKLNALSEILDASNLTSVVDMDRLRSLSSSGLPDHPPWLRPRVWKLLLGVVPVTKSQWAIEASKTREAYYDLVKRLLRPISEAPPPSAPLTSLDRSLLNTWEALARLPPEILSLLEQELELFDTCPLYSTAAPDIRISFAGALDRRLNSIFRLTAPKENNLGTPEIRLETEVEADSTLHQATQSTRPSTPTTLHPSMAFKSLNAHPAHVSALLRLLYIHSSLHPANHSPYMASILALLYTVLNFEIEPSELAHVEADTFWLFQAMVGEISELEDEEGGNVWMKKLGERLRWADIDLFEDLNRKGLDPALPHYSYKWLAPLLTHTLPLSSVFTVWDSILSRPARIRSTNFKLEYLLDVCVAMLCRARTRLARLGKAGRKSPSLWNDEDSSVPPPSPSRPWELNDAFMEGISLLQSYPIRDAGGIETIIRVASDLSARREEEANNQLDENLGISDKLRNAVWNKFIFQSDSTSEEASSTEEEVSEKHVNDRIDTLLNGTSNRENPISGIASRIGTTVWKGITNQSSMIDPPTPESSSPPRPSTKLIPKTDQTISTESTNIEPVSNIWGYAERLKDSNVAATLSKVSTNWSIRAREVWHTRSATSPVNVPLPNSPASASSATAKVTMPLSHKQEASQRGSLPAIDRTNLYSPPPPRPAYFRPPRDSWAPQDLEQMKSLSLVMPTSPDSPSAPLVPNKDDDDYIIKPLQSPPSSWSALRTPMSKSSSQKSGPRPLLLPSSVHARTDSSSSITATRSASTTPTPPQWQWTDVLRNRIQGRHKESQSSVSSISTVDTHDNTDGVASRVASRIVRLNRDSVSPMAPPFRKVRNRDSSASSLSGSDLLSPPPMPYPPLPSGISSRRGSSDGTPSTKGWEQIDVSDSPMTSPPLKTPPVYNLDISNTGSPMTLSAHRDPVSSHKDGLTALSIQTDTTKFSDKKTNSIPKTPPSHPVTPPEGETLSYKLSESQLASPTSALSVKTSTSDSSRPPSSPKVLPRIRSKRYTSQRPPHLRVRETEGKSPISPNQLIPSPNRSNSAEFELATTPRAADFLHTSPLDQISDMAHSVENQGFNTEKSIKDRSRPQEISDNTRSRDSGVEEEEDESYDELLSAYESESSLPPSEVNKIA